MASIINASTSSGLVNTADTSGDLELQSNGTTKVAVSSSGVALTGASLTSFAGGAITLGTAVASTSGTSIDFTSIPSWAKKITVMFQGVSTSGTAQVLVQIGTSGGVVATGYLGSACLNISGATSATNSIGFRVEPPDAAVTSSSVRHGVATLVNLTGNTWCFATNMGHSNTNCTTYGGGSLALSGVLDRVRITTTSTDTFDAGSINIQYEG
jgi:hypothetical protein